MKNRMNYTKAAIILISGMVAVTASIVLGAKHEAYGFLIGYGYTALAGGLVGLGYTYFRKQKEKKGAAIP